MKNADGSRESIDASALKALLDAEQSTINEIIKKNTTPFLFIDTLRAIDYYSIGNYPNKEEFDYFIQYGFSRMLEQIYQNLAFDAGFIPLYTSTINSLSFCHYYLIQYGKLRVAYRAVEMSEFGLVDLVQEKANYFKIVAPKEGGMEFFENKSIEGYFKIIREHVLADKIKESEKKRDSILNLMATQVKVWRKHYIQYDSTPEIDDYYYRKGYLELLGTQLFDDFGENQEFGGIKYKHFLDVAQSLMGTAIKHVDACLLLTKKNPKINLYNILPLPQIHNEIANQYSNYLGLDVGEVNEVLNVLTVSSSNIKEHIKADKSFSPPFIRIGSRFTVKSMKGCTNAPIMFLQNELKRRYEKDYMKGINERESVFREQLYSLFDDKRFIKLNRSVIIKSSIHTDIDAVLFDKEKRSLGLFQLKWQDKFSSDLKARRSRISNFYPKANEWVDKIWTWVSTNQLHTILSACEIPIQEVSEIYIFVIGRYSTHFSKEVIDDRAAWGSWYHVVELSHKIKTDFDDPIRELYFKLKVDSPRNKDISEEIDEEYEMKFSNFAIKWTNG